MRRENVAQLAAAMVRRSDHRIVARVDACDLGTHFCDQLSGQICDRDVAVGTLRAVLGGDELSLPGWVQLDDIQSPGGADHALRDLTTQPAANGLEDSLGTACGPAFVDGVNDEGQIADRQPLIQHLTQDRQQQLGRDLFGKHIVEIALIGLGTRRV